MRIAMQGTRNPNYKHGRSKSRLYIIWVNMKSRCYDEKKKFFANYGGRGIKVCKEWKEDFMIFQKWATSHGYAENLEIDRIDNNGNYGPKNCRWTTRSENSRNTRRSTRVLAFGEFKTVAAWAEDARCVVNSITLRTRLRRGTLPQIAISATRIIANQFMREAL